MILDSEILTKSTTVSIKDLIHNYDLQIIIFMIFKLLFFCERTIIYCLLLLLFVCHAFLIFDLVKHIVSDMLGDIAIPTVIDSEPLFQDDYSKVLTLYNFNQCMQYAFYIYFRTMKTLLV